MARAVLATIGFALLLVVALFVPAGRLWWPAAWGFLIGYALFAVAGFLILDRDLIEERSRLPADATLFDLAVAGLAFIFQGQQG